MTPGSNKAIFYGYDKGVVTHCSIMANGDYFFEAIRGLKNRKELYVGLHLNLTYGKALQFNPLYSDDRGVFKLGYLSILFKSMYNREFLRAVEEEFEKQISLVSKEGFDLTHLDSHRHIHLIPAIYRIVVKLAIKYNIKRIRLVNESIIDSVSLTKRYGFILNGGVIKAILLKTFSFFDAKYADFYKKRKFYSILYTGCVGRDVIQKLKASGDIYEIMVHPGIIEDEQQVNFYDQAEKKYRMSLGRELELEAVLSAVK